MITVKIEGGKEIQQVLDTLPLRIQGNVMTAALRAGGNIIRKELRARTPERDEPGAKAFKKGGTKGRLPGFARAAIRVAAQRGMRDVILVGWFSRAWYMRLYEFGSRHQPARPLLRPVFDTTQDAVLLKIGAQLRTVLDRIVTNLANQFHSKP